MRTVRREKPWVCSLKASLWPKQDSPLSVSHGHSGKLRAGDRVPDFPVTVVSLADSAGQEQKTATIFGLLDPSNFTLLITNIPEPAQTHLQRQDTLRAWHQVLRGHQIAAQQDGGSGFQELFGTSPSITLVRPDG